MVFAKTARRSEPKPNPRPAAEGNGAFSMKLPSRKTVAMFFPLLAVTTYLSNESVPGTMSDVGQYLRKLATIHCIHNIYATPENVMNMVPVPAKEPDHVPSYIAMCYDWVRHDAYPSQYSFDNVQINENVDVCLDWTAPHYAMLEILASSVLNTLVPNINYKHNCPKHRTYDEALLGYDWATVQSVFPESAMAVDQDLIDPLVFKEQCKICLKQFSAAETDRRSPSRSIHHCFAYPETFNGNQKITLQPTDVPVVLGIPSTPSGNNIVPLSSIVEVLRPRLQHVAEEWKDVTDTPPDEGTSGTVIFIDENSLGIDPKWYGIYTPADASSIIVMTSPLCSTAYLPSGEKCIDYANSVVDKLKEDFPNIGNTGFDGGPGIDLQIPVSTAGSLARMMNADKLICPPNTPPCLLPALGRKPKPDPATLFVGIPCPTCPPGSGTSAADFFNRVGTNGATEIVQLPDPESPTVVEGTPDEPVKDSVPPTAPNGQPIAPEFQKSLEPTTGDGYIGTDPPPPTVTQQDIAGKPDEEIVQDTTPKLPQSVQDSEANNPDKSPISALPNANYQPEETVPTLEEAQAAKDAGVPLDNNYQPPPLEESGQAPSLVSSELATDESMNFVSNPLIDSYLIDIATKRQEQIVLQESGHDKNNLPEVACPSSTLNEDVLIVEGGYVLVDNGDTVVLSDSENTLVFEAPVNIETVEEVTETDPITNVDYNCAPTLDPVSNQTVCVPTDQELINDPKTGQLNVQNAKTPIVVNPETKDCVAVMKPVDTAKNKKTNSKKTVNVCTGKLKSFGSQSLPQTEKGTMTQNNKGNKPKNKAKKNKRSNSGSGSGSRSSSSKNNGYVITKNNDFEGYEKQQPVQTNYGLLESHPCPDSDYQVYDFELNGNADQCGITGWQNPVYVRQYKGESVVFDVLQTWKGLDRISWVAVDYPNLSGTKVCPKYNEQAYGQQFSGSSLEAKCTGGFARIEVYIHDGSKNIGQTNGYDPTSDIPAHCKASKDKNNKCFYQFEIPCYEENCPPARRRLQENGVGNYEARFAADLIRRCGEESLKTKTIYHNFKFGGGIQHQEQPDAEVIIINVE